MFISRFLYIYIIYNIFWLYVTYIIITAGCKHKTQKKHRIDNKNIKYIKYNYITNKDTVWNHGEVAWETGWEKEKTELQTQPLFIVEYDYSSSNMELKNQNKCDETIQNQKIYLNASFFGFLKIFYEEFLRRDNFIIQFENIEQSLYNSVFLLFSLFMNIGYKQSKKLEILALSSNSISNSNSGMNDSRYLNQYMKIKKNSMSFFLVVFYIFIKNVGIAE
uniref:Uncharacterized protein n=1 Tax=viral metagenome TaxID=1070528 RepID=A0A6C0DGG5_9ZZZZ